MLAFQPLRVVLVALQELPQELAVLVVSVAH